MNNSSSNTTLKLPPKTSRSHVIFILQMTSLGVLGAVIILGNLASIITFIKTQSLRRRSYYLIICLAAADLLVGVVAFMLLYFFLTGSKFNAFALTMDFLDTLTTMASVLTLSAVSVERFFAILFPFRHRMLRFRAYVVLSISPWILSSVLGVMTVMSFFNRSVYFAFLHASFVIIGLALLTISASYISMGCKMRLKGNVSAQNQNRALRDKKLVVTLLIVTLSSLLTWMPAQVYIFVRNVCKKCPLPDFDDIFIMKFAQFCNSGLNIFIYMVRMADFRGAFLAIFCRGRERPLGRPNVIQRNNPAFLEGEGAAIPGRAMDQENGFDDVKAGTDNSTFNSPTNDAVEPRNSNNSQNPNPNGDECNSESNPNQVKVDLSMNPQYHVATQENDEPGTPEVLPNYNNSLKYETAEAQDTVM